LVLEEGEWSALRPGRFIRGETVPSTHWTGGWLNPRAGLDAVAKGKFPAPGGNRTLVVQPVA